MSKYPSQNGWGLAVAILMIGSVVAGGLYILKAPRAEVQNSVGEQGQVAGEVFSNEDQTEPQEGSVTAPVKIVLYTDLDCDFCRHFYQSVWQPARDQYFETGKVQAVVRVFPLGKLYNQENDVAELAYCAYQQGEFFEIMNAVFEGEKYMPTEQIKEIINTYVDKVALDNCQQSGIGRMMLGQASQQALEVGVTSVPAIEINGQVYENVTTFAQLQEILAQVLEEV